LCEEIKTPSSQQKTKLLVPITTVESDNKSDFNIISFITNPWFVGTISVAVLLGAIYYYSKFLR